MRVLITGSRFWNDMNVINAALESLTRSWMATNGEQQVTLVSGACPQGADRMGEIYAKSRGWEIETHPADWNKYGKRAGYIRNAEMVEKGADICVAFIRNSSAGASMTAALAQKAKIPTTTYRIGR